MGWEHRKQWPWVEQQQLGQCRIIMHKASLCPLGAAIPTWGTEAKQRCIMSGGDDTQLAESLTVCKGPCQPGWPGLPGEGLWAEARARRGRLGAGRALEREPEQD